MRVISTFLVEASLVMACSSVQDPPAIRFEPAIFPSETGDSVRGGLGYLDVHENHDDLGSASVRLAVGRFASRDPRSSWFSCTSR